MCRIMNIMFRALISLKPKPPQSNGLVTFAQDTLGAPLVGPEDHKKFASKDFNLDTIPDGN